MWNFCFRIFPNTQNVTCIIEAENKNTQLCPKIKRTCLENLWAGLLSKQRVHLQDLNHVLLAGGNTTIEIWEHSSILPHVTQTLLAKVGAIYLPFSFQHWVEELLAVSSTAQQNRAREKAGKGAKFLSGCYQSTLLAPAATAAYPRAVLADWLSIAPTGSANKHGTDDMLRQQQKRTSEEDLDKPDSHQDNPCGKPEKPPERQRKLYMCR